MMIRIEDFNLEIVNQIPEIPALAITDALIASATITNAKIVNIDAGKITTGYLAAASITTLGSDIDSMHIRAGKVVLNTGLVIDLDQNEVELKTTGSKLSIIVKKKG